jgi:hypothetical protein
MSRAALKNTKILLLCLAIPLAMAVVVTGVVYGIRIHRGTVHTVVDGQHHITQISYKGEAGTDALTLLKRHATVQTKHYSFGDMVISIDGVPGTGPKYWTFYINGHEATVGAQAYHAKSSDELMWRLQ